MRLSFTIIALCITLCASGAAAAQSLFSASTGTVCSASFDATAKTVKIDCQLGSAPVISGLAFNPHLLEGAGNGLVLSVNGVTMLFKKTLATDPMTYQAAVSDGTTTKQVANGSVTVP